MKENKYTVRKVELGEQASLRDIWHRLEAGPDMTYFQKYEWYEVIRQFVPEAKGIECGYYVVERDSETVMIAPLWILTRTIRWFNHPGVYLLGRKGYSDYLNLIYDDFDEDAMRFLVQYVESRYNVTAWFFEYLPDSALLTHILKNIERKAYDLKHKSALTYCGVTLPTDESEYMKSLSQKTRQNIRTAINRAKKDGLSLVINYNDDGMRLQCAEIRNDWMKKKIKRDNSMISLKGKIYLKARWLMYERFIIKFPKYSPIVDTVSTKLLTIKDESTDEIAAFFNYGVDEAHRTIVVITAGVNEKYARYSPGLVCAKDFICNCISEGHISYYDFTRGTEPYKYWLGAKDHKVTNISICLHP